MVLGEAVWVMNSKGCHEALLDKLVAWLDDSYIRYYFTTEGKGAARTGTSKVVDKENGEIEIKIGNQKFVIPHGGMVLLEEWGSLTFMIPGGFVSIKEMDSIL